MLYDERVTVERAAQPAAGQSGSAERVYVAVASLTNIPFSLQARSGSYRQREYGMEREAQFAGYSPGTPDIRPGDRILHGTTRYDVMFVATRHGHHIECDLVLVTMP